LNIEKVISTIGIPNFRIRLEEEGIQEEMIVRVNEIRNKIELNHI